MFNHSQINLGVAHMLKVLLRIPPSVKQQSPQQYIQNSLIFKIHRSFV